MTLREYGQQSKEVAVGIFFVIPCLAIYEIGIVQLGSGVRNGADVLMRSCFALFGARGPLVFNFLVLAAFIVAAIVLLRRNRPVFALYPAILLESALYALLLAPTVLFFEDRLFPYLCAATGKSLGETGRLLSIVLSIGAGVYEELFFRLFLLGGLVFVLERYGEVRRWVAVTVALLVSAAVFSAFHHLGAFGEPFRLAAFVFRAISGMMLGVIFLTRGLAVVVYTHAFYDILILLQQHSRMTAS
ncbi:MAG: CPBP family intramembrane metalloprotease [Planctomycetes bacterium]|nr:CPBP family intramembrane metalloprotease [Planctomycetota bacterium]MBI3847941.1 CPBP family intramembrane metalloprotease [Planctomycetota bacterium]